MMWWDIIKAQLRSKEMINLDWEEEAVPMQEEEDCKKKLLSVYEYIRSSNDIKFNETNDNGQRSLTRFVNNFEPGLSPKFQIFIHLRFLDKFSNEEVCTFNEYLKQACQAIIDGKDLKERIPTRNYEKGHSYARVRHAPNKLGFNGDVSYIAKEDSFFSLEFNIAYFPFRKEYDTISDEIVSLVTKIKGML